MARASIGAGQRPVEAGPDLGSAEYPGKRAAGELELPVAEQAGPDLWFHRMPPDDGLMIPVPAGHFAIFLPGEAHKPCCHIGSFPAPFRKCVVKVQFAD